MNDRLQSEDFTGPYSVNEGVIDRLKNYLDFTYSESGVDESLPATEEQMYNLGANHAFYDSLSLLSDPQAVPEDEKADHTKRNLVLAFAGGALVGSWVERKRIDRAFNRMSRRIKNKLRDSGWVDYSKVVK